MKFLLPTMLLGLAACVETSTEAVTKNVTPPIASAQSGVTGYTVHRKNGVTTIVGNLN